jgi:hypothetical protein
MKWDILYFVRVRCNEPDQLCVVERVNLWAICVPSILFSIAVLGSVFVESLFYLDG